VSGPRHGGPGLGARAARLLVSLPIHAYRLFLSPVLAPACRFQPSCSAYALEAIQMHGALRGGWLAVRRIARCRPGGGSGLDPVPPLAQHRLSDVETLRNASPSADPGRPEARPNDGTA